MSAVCPEGHSSQSTDYCDVCGAPMAATGGEGGAGAAAQGSAGAAAPEPTTCPHCKAPAPAGALFCENCGYDFTTGTAPSSSAAWAAPGASGGASAASGPGASSLDLEPAAGAGAGAGAGAEASAAAAGAHLMGDPVASAPAGSEPAADPASGEPAADPAGSDPAGEPASGAAAGSDPAASSGAGPSTPSRGLPTPSVPGPAEWVAEVWIDPDWYRAQDPEDPIPSVGMPLVVPLRARSVLVGRPSSSRGIHPDVDCGADNGVSRRQCQLSTDGLRWWVEDLGSANGTYVSPVGEALPTTPIAGGERVELEEGARIFVGGWTRIVVRQGIPGEV